MQTTDGEGMNVLIFGATGMVGQGVLRECLFDPDVRLVQTIGRTPNGVQHAKLREIVQQDLGHYADIETDLSGSVACFFCLGVDVFGNDGGGLRARDLRHHDGSCGNPFAASIRR
jgi:uncharacterized protein YbjT (DUF2867 family)